MPAAPRKAAARPAGTARKTAAAAPRTRAAPKISPAQWTGGSPFPPIAEYAFLSDCHSGALIAPDGSVEWLCLPRFDSPSIFGALLDRSAGTFRIAPYGVDVPAGRRYEPGTNVLETTWMTPTGWLVVRDAMTIGPWHRGERGGEHVRPPTDHEADHLLVRTVECLQGEVPLELVCAPRFEYGKTPAKWTFVDEDDDGVLDASDGKSTVRLFSDLRIGIEGFTAHARHTMREGEKRFCALSWTEQRGGPRTVEQATEHIQRTSHFWREWLAAGHYPDHPWRGYLQRSALVLKGLTYAPTGAMIAALTTSLPETPGGERNWDYRYCWMRDATFTLWGLHALDLDWEANDFMEYLADLKRNGDGSLQIMYGIGGERNLRETTIRHLKGYAGSRPVRKGNGAYNQQQNDVYGAVLDSVYLHTKRHDHINDRLWPVLSDQVTNAWRVWRRPDQGIWEARGKPRHYVSSKLMCWVALDRGARLAELRGDGDLAKRWQDGADTIRADILEKGVDSRGVFVQHYDTDALDASTLLIPIVRFLPSDDRRVRATVLAIADELSDHGLILRYRTEETDDGLSGEEGTFLICSFWMVSALSEIGEAERAKALCERLLSLASPLGLYAEELDARSGRHLGNFPQAFTHLALINAVSHVVSDER
ncbi:MAG TPA: glycoside hydrolase family 15 protein [Solirubrobacteraceae bacterium]|jgi:GH15 family glucan-1,4-alpha-glucosidase|nr:glycoside hydrolase family 15 protein [Solirubrobacteraceae bacterium]